MAEKKYHVVCYMRIEPEEVEPQTYKDALRNKEPGVHAAGNIYRIEEFKDSE